MLRTIQIIKSFGFFVTDKLAGFTQLALRLPKRMKSSMAIIVLVTTVILAGHTVSAQVAEPPSLKTITTPKPSNQAEFVKDETATIALGKAFFWDMQVGSDGLMSCATCHFHAGADNRSKNQLHPGFDQKFVLGLNHQLQQAEYPFHKLQDPNVRTSQVVGDSNDVTGSQGVHLTRFNRITPGSDKDNVTVEPDNVFNVGGKNVRQVTDRNAPTVINAVFNFRNFWDGRAQDTFNGVNPFGLRDANAKLVKADKPNQLEEVQVRLNNSSLASQAVGPPLSAVEESATDREFDDLSRKLAGGKGKKRLRETGKKLRGLTPLGKQLVATDDSVLGGLSNASKPGLNTSYQAMIKKAFQPQWWKSNQLITVSTDANNVRTIAFSKKNEAKKADEDEIVDANQLESQQFTLMDYNFPLFFGLAVQMYESTLVSNDTPFDRYKEGATDALTAQQKNGLNLFLNSACIACHKGAEFTAASVTNVNASGRLTRSPAPGNPIEDTGFFRIGVRADQEDLGQGAQDNLNPSRSLSEAVIAKAGQFQTVFNTAPNIAVGPNDPVLANGVFKAPTIRNVELTAPYMHNGGMSTLRQVVDFYSRGAGDDNPQRPALPVLNLNEGQKEELVAFMKALTDDRVRYEKAPFDHPQLFISNGHPGNETSVSQDLDGKATDDLLVIPAVGRDGGSGTPNFLGL
jgi:cytochrome c peroxidase